ncbi:hypothetical protein OA851_01310 [SAR86 cluster bacterium]|nr:hypothetical protein [SAR86 cluster bacterium]
MNIIEFIQISSVIFGTVLAAPLIVSKKVKKRAIGLLAIITGSLLAMIVQFYSGLYYFLFASGFWLINSFIALKKIHKSKRGRI